jgi:hypothetical protein
MPHLVQKTAARLLEAEREQAQRESDWDPLCHSWRRYRPSVLPRDHLLAPTMLGWLSLSDAPFYSRHMTNLSIWVRADV